MKNPTLLIVEDEAPIRDMLKFALEPAGFKVFEAENAAVAKQRIATHRPDLILLDWMLPGLSGIDFIGQLKQQTLTQDIPIILLTACAEENNKVRGLEVGADDYITKPFSPRELIARIKSVLRRGTLMSPEGILKKQDLWLDANNHRVTIKQQPLTLTPLEYRLLHFFMKHPAKVYSRSQLLDLVWKGESDVNERTIDVQVRRLRDRLKPYGYADCIQTVRGAGYCWTGDDV